MSFIVISQEGPACPRCGRPMQVCEPRGIGPKQLRKQYYYRRWYCCVHANCRTTIVHNDQFRVFNDPAEGEQERRLQAIREQLRPRE